MRGTDLMDALRRKLAAETWTDLKKRLGVTVQVIHGWRRQQRPLTARQVANVVASAQHAAIRDVNRDMIKPVVEYFPLEAVKTKGGEGVKYRMFPAGSDGTKYTSQLRDILRQTHGVFIFYDSRGRALYAGKAKKLSLWQEMNNVLNRERTGQVVYRVKHPTADVRFREADEKKRKIREHSVLLHEVAAYISAYSVYDAAIDGLEALLVRSFANDLLNRRMEAFR